MTEAPDAAELKALAAATREVYDRNAARFDAERPKRLHERAWLDRFRALLPAGGRVLDVGCGAGDPIAGYFTRFGHPVTGIDFSHSMLDLARMRYPDGDWRHADMLTLDLREHFAGIIGWNSFFHLTPAEQRSTIPRLAEHLAPGGALMLTVGPRAGEVTGRVGDDRVYHSSLSPDEYEAILAGLGLGIVAFAKEDPDCDLQTILLAQMRGD